MDQVDTPAVEPAAKPPQLRKRLARKQRLLRDVVLVFVLGFFIVPLISMFVFSSRFALTGVWTARAWKTLFSGPDGPEGQSLQILFEGIQISAGLAILTVVFMLLLLLPTMLYLKIHGGPMERAVEFISLLPLAIPAIVLVVGLAPIYRFISIYLLNTDSIWMSFAYVILVLPYAYRSLAAGLSAIDVKTLVETARSLGASWARVMFKVIIPNIRQAILSACFISIAVVLGEYTIAAILNRNNLQVALFAVGQNDSMVATLMALLTLLFGMLLLLTLGIIGERKKK